MSITDLLKQASADQVEGPLPPVHRPAAPQAAPNPVQDLKDRAQDALFGRLGNRLYDASLSEDQLHAMVVQELDSVLMTEAVPLTDDERHRLVTDISDNILGLGPIEPFLSDPSVTEVMANGDDAIFIERAGRIVMTDARFNSSTHLRQVIERIVTAVGRRIDESSPMVDARLPDGSRVNAVVPPLAVDGPMLTIRKFSHEALQTEDLLANHTLSDQFAEFIGAAVEGKLNILVTGGTGTGKTTLLNVVSVVHPRGGADRDDRGRGRAAASISAMSSGWRAARRTSRAGVRSRSATWFATPFACGPTASSSARFAAARHSTCCRR